MSQIARRKWVVVMCATVVLLTASSVAAQDTPGGGDLEEWQRQELQSLVEVVSAALSGQIVPAEDPFEFRPDFLKGTDGNAYVPFTLSIDQSKVRASSLAMYLIVVDPLMMPAPAATDDDDGDADETPPVPAMPPAVFEDAYFAEVTAGGTEPVEISRAFLAPGGEYDVYLAIRDSSGGEEAEDQTAAAAPVMMLRKRVSIPDLWDGTLQTSTVLIAEVVEPLDAPLTPEQQMLSPYTLGTTRIVPKFDRSFGKQEELSLIFLVYNPGLRDESKPDVTIEYNFHQQTADGEEFFNKTNPQQFNDQTLPPGFDLTLGHQIVAGQTVPLSLFPAGDYRLEIKVTDNARSSEVIQNLTFTVRET